VGLFRGEEVFGLGVVDRATAQGAEELLGYWVIPVCVAGALLLYLAATWLLRRLLKNFVKRGRQARRLEA
jgi:flagellar biogenesis protein FliO